MRSNELDQMAKDVALQSRTHGEAAQNVAHALGIGLITKAEASELEQLVFDRIEARQKGKR